MLWRRCSRWRTDLPLQHAEARLTRWTVNLADGSNTVKREQIHDDLYGEFPRFDERRVGLLLSPWLGMRRISALENPLVFNAVAHLDLKTGKREVRSVRAGGFDRRADLRAAHAGCWRRATGMCSR